MDEFKIEAVKAYAPGTRGRVTKCVKTVTGVMAGSLLLSSCIMIGIPYTPCVNVQITTDKQEPIPGLKVSPSWGEEAQWTNEYGYVSFFDSTLVREGSITITDVDGPDNGSYAQKIYDIPDEGDSHIVTMEETAPADEQ